MRIVQSLLGIFLIAFILLGNAGLRVFKHSCEEDGTFTSYIIPADDHCQEVEIEELPSCCKMELVEESCCGPEMSDEDDCCSDEVNIYTVDFNYFQDVDSELLNLAVDLDHILLEYYEVFTSAYDKQKEFLRPPPDPPGGRDILILNQEFRI